ncbi:MAG: MogA/MoaB family molybdenum cofactor biosynthesis protein [Deltaproteobacteria bacterium]|nr:MogA/MoaB family molybdenum cofactor biosynthesis protein [Deltaproteobacteria bacterium]
MIRAAVITVSDRGFRGEREDMSGQEVAHMLSTIGAEAVFTTIIPDEKDMIKEILLDCSDNKNLELIITTGGTGVSPRDVTPDATLEVIEREVPGMAEAMRLVSASITPHAMISRAVVGIRGCSLIVNLPGSPRGVRENLSVILPALVHAIEKIRGDDAECAS